MADQRWFLLRIADGEPPDWSRATGDVRGRRFSHLPFAAAQAAPDAADALAAIPGVLRVTPMIADDARVVDGIDSILRHADQVQPHLHVAVISISLGTNQYVTGHLEDPVNVATRIAAERMPVVVAVGNAPPEPGLPETMSAWAEPPWVISVAGTDDPEGGPVRPSSSAGVEEDHARWPTVCAFGASALDEDVRGTSFAAPWVARQLLLMTAFLQNVRAVAAGDAGVPLQTAFVIDRHVGLWDPQIQLPFLPATAVDADAARAVAALVKVTPSPAALRALLISSARPLEGEPPHRAGHGFVNDDTTRECLQALTAADLARLFGVEPPGALETLRLADAARFDSTLETWRRAILVSAFDIAYDDIVEPGGRPVV